MLILILLIGRNYKRRNKLLHLNQRNSIMVKFFPSIQNSTNLYWSKKIIYQMQKKQLLMIGTNNFDFNFCINYFVFINKSTFNKN
jgi:hypothetical protein